MHVIGNFGYLGNFGALRGDDRYDEFE